MKTAVLVSGTGSNLQNLIDAQSAGRLAPAQIVLVASNVPGCRALARADGAGIPTFALDHRDHPRREDFDGKLLEALRASRVELVVLAGFMRLLGPAFLAAFPDRVVNIHPALLPAFPGVRAQKQALEHGVKLSGCTVHFVDAGVDSGPIIAQAVVPVLPDDDEDRLRERILIEEHRLLPAVVQALAEGRVERRGRQTNVRGGLR